MKNVVLSFFVLAFICSSCKNKTAPAVEPVADTPTPETVLQDTSTVPTGDNSRVSLDWPGVYNGTLPCKDCKGVNTKLELKLDNTFTMSEEFVGSKSKKNELSGKFVWDKEGFNITLLIEPKTRKFGVGENALYQLDSLGKIVEGAMADKFVLTKK
jgi:uncharacterized lipoprotein NlpE involved in copper resistance